MPGCHMKSSSDRVEHNPLSHNTLRYKGWVKMAYPYNRNPLIDRHLRSTRTTGDTESSLCARGDFVAVIYTDSQKAGYVLLLRESFCLSIDQHYRSLFFKGIIFKVSEEVADLFLSFHAQRNKPVSLAPSAAYKREFHFVGIHNQYPLRLFQRHFSAPRKDLDSKSDSVEIICS